jgi:hypothetical protein
MTAVVGLRGRAIMTELPTTIRASTTSSAPARIADATVSIKHASLEALQRCFS